MSKSNMEKRHMNWPSSIVHWGKWQMIWKCSALFSVCSRMSGMSLPMSSEQSKDATTVSSSLEHVCTLLPIFYSFHFYQDTVLINNMFINEHFCSRSWKFSTHLITIQNNISHLPVTSSCFCTWYYTHTHTYQMYIYSEIWKMHQICSQKK